MKKILVLFLLICFAQTPLIAAEYDSSIDSDIRKQYKVDELPELPNVIPTKTEMPKEIKNYNVTGKVYTLKSGTRITLRSKETISNWKGTGSKVSFLLQNQITTKEGTVIPAGTLFKGTITNSHGPQITGNGGLIELKIDEIYYNGIMSPINTKLTEANSKKVFRNDIKGKRKYWQNTAKAMTPSKKTFAVMHKAAQDLNEFPILNLLGAATYLIGGAAVLINLPIAPIASVFMKGGSVSLNSGTVFYITILGNNQIRG